MESRGGSRTAPTPNSSWAELFALFGIRRATGTEANRKLRGTASEFAPLIELPALRGMPYSEFRRLRPIGTLRAPQPAFFGLAGGNHRAHRRECRRALAVISRGLADVIENAALPHPIAGVRGNGTAGVPEKGRGKHTLAPSTAPTATPAGRRKPAFRVRKPLEGLAAQGR